MKLSKLIKAIVIALLILAMAAACACTEKHVIGGADIPDPTEEETVTAAPQATEEATEEPARVSDLEAALSAYREIIKNAEAYDFGVDEEMPVTGIKYALVQMQSGDAVPTLLLAKATGLGTEYVRVFRYDPVSGAVLEPMLPDGGMLMRGAASAGGFRGEISVLEDGSGLCAYEFYSGTGEGEMKRVTADGDKLTAETIWSGRVDDEDTVLVADNLPIDLHAYDWFAGGVN